MFLSVGKVFQMNDTYFTYYFGCDLCKYITLCKFCPLRDKCQDCLSFHKQKLSSIFSSFILYDKFVSITATLAFNTDLNIFENVFQLLQYTVIFLFQMDFSEIHILLCLDQSIHNHFPCKFFL